MVFYVGWNELFALFAIIITAIVVYYRNAYKYWQRRNCPYLRPTFPLGNTNILLPRGMTIGTPSKDFYDQLKKLGHKFGGIYLVTQPCLVIVDPEYIKDILVKDFQHFIDRGFYYNKADDPLSAHLFAIDGADWKYMRNKLTPTFTSGKMKMMFGTIINCSNYMVESLKDNDDVDIKHVVSCFTTDVIGECAFGIKCNSFKNPDAEFRRMGVKIFEAPLTRVMRAFMVINFPKLSLKWHIHVQQKEVADFFLKVVQDVIEYRAANNIQQNDFLQLLINIRSEDFDLKEIAAQVFLFFVAGFDTSSTTMAFALYELARNPLMQERLRAEIADTLAKSDGEITYENIAGMKYLDQVVDETLRMYPPLPTINRRCTQTYKMRDSDVVIEKGTAVFISPLGLHMDPEYYPDPERFDPDRFADEEKEKRHPFAHIPFGYGLRNCIGLRFGLMQSKIGIVTILNSFKVSVSHKTKPVVLDPRVFLLKPMDPIYLQLEKIR